MANEWLNKAGAPIRRYLNKSVNELRAAGDAARDRSDWAEAAERYRAYLDKRPDDDAIWIQLGHALKEGGDLDGARAAYDVPLGRDPDDADLQLNLGHLAKKRGDLGEAAYRYLLSHRIDGNVHAERELRSADLQLALLDAEARLAAER